MLKLIFKCVVGNPHRDKTLKRMKADFLLQVLFEMKKKKKAWVVAVGMGYGHQRAAIPFRDIAEKRVLIANSDPLVSPEEQQLWKRMQKLYETISRFTSIPYIGQWLFHQYDRFQRILPLYPFRDLSRPTLQIRYFAHYIKKGLGRSITQEAQKKKLPFLTTFFATAIAADEAGIKPVYCVVTDSDIHRVWVATNPKQSNITYLAPTLRVVRRLQEYGVPEERIIMTGFPLPKENVGGPSFPTIKKNLIHRLVNLDPRKQLIEMYEDLTTHTHWRKTHPLTLTFVVGGAGAQSDIGVKIIYSLRDDIREGRIRLWLVAGTRKSVAEIFEKAVRKAGLAKMLGKGIDIHQRKDVGSYFSMFSDLLHETDILWTKTSELSFYTALGIPIICAPPIGAHEIYNRRWLQEIGGGIVQDDPNHTHEWLFDWLQRGILAKAAVDGFTLAPKTGTYKIEKILFSR
jgi:UDP-N-acetylglucosamine:LPS N-acetylglucosamine transferase